MTNQRKFTLPVWSYAPLLGLCVVVAPFSARAAPRTFPRTPPKTAPETPPPPKTEAEKGDTDLLVPLTETPTKSIVAHPVPEESELKPVTGVAAAEEKPAPAPGRSSVLWLGLKLGYHLFPDSGNMSELTSLSGVRPQSFGRAMHGLAPAIAVEYRPVHRAHEKSSSNAGLVLEASHYQGTLLYDNGSLFNTSVVPVLLSLGYWHDFKMGLQLMGGLGGGLYFVRRGFTGPGGDERTASETIPGAHARIGVGYRVTDWLTLMLEDRYSIAPSVSRSLARENMVVDTNEGGNVVSLSLMIPL